MGLFSCFVTKGFSLLFWSSCSLIFYVSEITLRSVSYSLPSFRKKKKKRKEQQNLPNPSNYLEMKIYGCSLNAYIFLYVRSWKKLSHIKSAGQRQKLNISQGLSAFTPKEDWYQVQACQALRPALPKAACI